MNEVLSLNTLDYRNLKKANAVEFFTVPVVHKRHHDVEKCELVEYIIHVCLYTSATT